MKLEDIEYVKRDHAAWITLNRPRALNAITVGMLHSLKQAFEDARDDDQVRVVVITGAGRGFCAGADVKVMHGQSLEEMRTFDKLLTSTWKFIPHVSEADHCGDQRSGCRRRLRNYAAV